MKSRMRKGVFYNDEVLEEEIDVSRPIYRRFIIQLYRVRVCGVNLEPIKAFLTGARPSCLTAKLGSPKTRMASPCRRFTTMGLTICRFEP